MGWGSGGVTEERTSNIQHPTPNIQREERSCDESRLGREADPLLNPESRFEHHAPYPLGHAAPKSLTSEPETGLTHHASRITHHASRGPKNGTPQESRSGHG